MAENLRTTDSGESLSDQRKDALVKECRRQEESCLYTSTSLYIWLRKARWIRRLFIVAPVILGALATWSVLDQPGRLWLVWLTASFALLAGLFPAIFKSLDLDTEVDEISRQAALYKSLQDRFRLAAEVTSRGSFEEFRSEFNELMNRLDDTRSTSITPPERCFESARKKIKSGHYEFSLDQNDSD